MDTAFLWLVLTRWAIPGLLLRVVGHFKNAGAASLEAELEAEAAA